MGTGRAYEVIGADGAAVRYAETDFDEIWTTTDVHEARRHVGLGWILLDESVGPSDEPAVEVLDNRAVASGIGGGSYRTVPVPGAPDDEITYVLGYLKPGHEGTPQA
jgi:hypothetical protein